MRAGRGNALRIHEEAKLQAAAQMFVLLVDAGGAGPRAS